MARNIWVEEDEFAVALSEILGGIADGADEATFQLVHDSVSEGRDEWRKNAKAHGWKDYPDAITYRTLRKRGTVEGHIYSKKPGLPHLLEKGHTKIGGGSTRAYPHVKPAADYAFQFARDHLGEYIARYLR